MELVEALTSLFEGEGDYNRGITAMIVHLFEEIANLQAELQFLYNSFSEFIFQNNDATPESWKNDITKETTHILNLQTNYIKRYLDKPFWDDLSKYLENQ